MKKRLATAVVVVLVSVIPLTVLAINVYALRVWLEIRELEATGVTAEAVVVAKEASESPRNSTYRVTLSYMAQGRVLTTQQVVDDALFRRLAVGSKVTMKVDVRQTDVVRAHIRGNDIYIKPILFALVGDVLLAIGLMVLYRRKQKPAGSFTA